MPYSERWYCSSTLALTRLLAGSSVVRHPRSAAPCELCSTARVRRDAARPTGSKPATTPAVLTTIASPPSEPGAVSHCPP